MTIGKKIFPLYNRKWDGWFNFYIENPFKTWWKVRKYFKRPKTRIKFFYKLYHPYASSSWCGKILDIKITDLKWKDKWNSPRHEGNPLIYFCLFKRFGFYITTCIEYYNEFGEKENGDMEYWEYILNYLYYKKRLRSYSGWTGYSKLYRERIYSKSEDGSEDTFVPYKYVVPCVAMSLNKKGIAKLKEELNANKEKNNSNN